MVRFLYYFCLILAAAAPVAAQASLHSIIHTRSVHFTTDPEKHGGFLSAITKAAFERVGYKVYIDYRPWKRALQDVISGRTEALLGALYSDQRAQYLLYSQEIGRSDLVFFTLRNPPLNYHSMEDLAGLRVGTINGSVYPPEFMAMDSIQKDTVTNFRLNIRKLLAGRLPVFVEKRGVVVDAMHKEFPQDAARVIALSPPLDQVSYFNAFSRMLPDSAQKLADFNRGLKIIHQDGTYDAIIKLHQHE